MTPLNTNEYEGSDFLTNLIEAIFSEWFIAFKCYVPTIF